LSRGKKLSSDITAVLVAYWPERFPNLSLQIGDLLTGTVAPDKIIVVNNNPKKELPSLPRGVTTIQSNRNFTSRSKYAVAMLEPSAHYILLDDDISVSKYDLERYLDHAQPGFALCDWGVRFTDSNFISKGRGLLSRMVSSLTPVDSFIGRAQFLTFEAIVKMFEAEAKCRIPYLPQFRSVAEDILVALCNPQAYVCPGIHHRELDHYKVAMEYDPGYFEFRDYFAYHCMRQLGLLERPGDAPTGEKYERIAAEYLALVAERDKVVAATSN
jgi:hypothetical protein